MPIGFVCQDPGQRSSRAIYHSSESVRRNPYQKLQVSDFNKPELRRIAGKSFSLNLAHSWENQWGSEVMWISRITTEETQGMHLSYVQPLLFCCGQQPSRTLGLYECLQDLLLGRKSFLHLEFKPSFPFTLGTSHFLSHGSLDWRLMWLAVIVHYLFCWDSAFLAL